MNCITKFRLTLIPVLMLAAALPAVAQAPAACDCPSITSSGEVAMSGPLTVQATRQLNSCVTETDVKGTVDCNVRSSCSPQGSSPERCTADVAMTVTTVVVTCPDGSSRSSQMCSGRVKFFNTPKGFTLSSCALSGQIDGTGKLTFSLSSFESSVITAREAGSGMATGRMATSPTGVTFTASCSYIGHVTIVK